MTLVDEDGNEWQVPVDMPSETLRAIWPDCPVEIDQEIGQAMLEEATADVYWKVRHRAPAGRSASQHRAPVIRFRMARPRERRSRRARSPASSSSRDNPH